MKRFLFIAIPALLFACNKDKNDSKPDTQDQNVIMLKQHVWLFDSSKVTDISGMTSTQVAPGPDSERASLSFTDSSMTTDVYLPFAFTYNVKYESSNVIHVFPTPDVQVLIDTINVQSVSSTHLVTNWQTIWNDHMVAYYHAKL